MGQWVTSDDPPRGLGGPGPRASRTVWRAGAGAARRAIAWRVVDREGLGGACKRLHSTESGAQHTSRCMGAVCASCRADRGTIAVLHNRILRLGSFGCYRCCPCTAGRPFTLAAAPPPPQRLRYAAARCQHLRGSARNLPDPLRLLLRRRRPSAAAACISPGHGLLLPAAAVSCHRTASCHGHARAARQGRWRAARDLHGPRAPLDAHLGGVPRAQEQRPQVQALAADRCDSAATSDGNSSALSCSV